MDVLSTSQRSHCMAQIRGRDTAIELILRSELWRSGLRYRLRSKLTGRPDIVFPSSRVAVFVDGCFWHGCPEHATKPATNSEFWSDKLGRNRSRDREVTAKLESGGWRVIRFWEHEVKADPKACGERIRKVVKQRLAERPWLPMND